MKKAVKGTSDLRSLYQAESDCYIYDDLNVLVIYGDNSSFTKTVEEHLNSFKQYLPFNVYYANGILDYNNISWLDDFDVIIIHYSLCLYNLNYASKEVLEEVKKSRALKIVFGQDEYDNTNELIQKVNDLGTDIYFTSVPTDLQDKVFGGRLKPTVKLIYNFTGYVANYQKFVRQTTKDLGQRKYTVTYRGRPLHPKHGFYGYLKWNAGKDLNKYCKKNNIISDITVSEEGRLYWTDWHDLLLESRAMLATPSGSNVFDFDGSVREKIDQKYGNSKFDHYPQIVEQLKPIEEEFFGMGQISPKIFEMMAFGVVPLVIPAQLIPEMKPDENYIEVSPDLDNFDDVFSKVKDNELCEKIISNNHQIIDSDKYSYKTFIGALEELIRVKVDSGKGIEFLTTAYAKKKMKINWRVFPENNLKPLERKWLLARRNFETINYSIMPRDSFTSSIQYHMDIWSYHEYLRRHEVEPTVVVGKFLYNIGKPFRFLKHLLKHEIRVFKNNGLVNLQDDTNLHRRILARIFLTFPKKVKVIIYRLFT